MDVQLQNRLAVVAVVQFFLRLFKLQLRAPDSSPARYILIDTPHNQNEFTYELSVKRKGAFESRRITVGTIGEGSGSKSKCFKVIYDEQIAIKIPPTPIIGFYDYIKRIEAERSIVDQHSEAIKFIAPCVSVALNKIHVFEDADQLSEEELEKRYIRWLDKNPEYHKYLQINGSFVFFMDLSKYFFLSRAIESLHNPAGDIIDEMTQYPNPLWDAQVFEQKFGRRHFPLLGRMKRIFTGYQQKIASATENLPGPRVSDYDARKWYLLHLAGEHIAPNTNGWGQNKIDELNGLIKGHLDRYPADISTYRRLVEDYVRSLTFSQYAPHKAGIIVNLLELLASLYQTGLSIRDLKPDNVFVAGKSEEYPSFLAWPEKFSMGLIDLETAVVVGQRDTEAIKQPLLGGTPSFATPSHLFSNKILRQVFNDLARLFYHQDWYAVIGMIYETVIGERLFLNTRKILSQVRSIAQTSLNQNRSLNDVMKDCSRIFWLSARDEIHARSRYHRKALQDIGIVLTDEVATMLIESAVKEKQYLRQAIVDTLASNSALAARGDFTNLANASLQEIVQHRCKLVEQAKKDRKSKPMRRAVIKILNDIEQLQSQAHRQDQRIQQLSQSRPKLSAYDLLTVMFSIVLTTMYTLQWGPLPQIRSAKRKTRTKRVKACEASV